MEPEAIDISQHQLRCMLSVAEREWPFSRASTLRLTLAHSQGFVVPSVFRSMPRVSHAYGAPTPGLFTFAAPPPSGTLEGGVLLLECAGKCGVLVFIKRAYCSDQIFKVLLKGDLEHLCTAYHILAVASCGKAW